MHVYDHRLAQKLLQPCSMVVRSLGVPQITRLLLTLPPNEMKARSHLLLLYFAARPPKTKASINLVIAVSVGARMLFPYSIHGANPGSPPSPSSLSSIWASAVGTTHPRIIKSLCPICHHVLHIRPSSSSEFRSWPADFRIHKIWGAKLGQATRLPIRI